MDIKFVDKINDEIINIRKEVFIDEQKFSNEFDAIDNKAIYFIMYDDKLAIGTCRVYYNDVYNLYVIGRIAFKKEYRGKGYGSMIIKRAEEYLINKEIYDVGIIAQDRVLGFYNKIGYTNTFYKEIEDDIPHTLVKKNLMVIKND